MSNEYENYLEALAIRGGSEGLAAQEQLEKLRDAEVKKSNEDEARDEHGRWVSGGGGDSSKEHAEAMTKAANEAEAKSKSTTDPLKRESLRGQANALREAAAERVAGGHIDYVGKQKEADAAEKESMYNGRSTQGSAYHGGRSDGYAYAKQIASDGHR